MKQPSVWNFFFGPCEHARLPAICDSIFKKGVNRQTDQRISKILLPSFRIQSEILTDFRILELQRIAD